MDIVFAAKCERYDFPEVEKQVRRIISAFGGAEAFLKKGKKVTLKANLLLPREPENGATTHPMVVAAIAKCFVEVGAEVTIADSPGGPYNSLTLSKVYDVCGMKWAAETSCAKLNFDLSAVTRIVRTEDGTRAFELIAPAAQADVLISVAKMKTHSLAYFTGAAKNMFGTVAGLNKAAYHANLPRVEDFSAMIVDLCRAAAPALSIIDGIIGMEGNGPSGGTPREAGILLGSLNPFAADLAAMRYCGLSPELSPVHRRARALGLVSDTEMRGDDAPPLEKPFLPAFGGKKIWQLITHIPAGFSKIIGEKFRPYPKISERCVGCGICAQSCPAKAITVAEGRARIEREKCIRCYCCHEMCRIKAVDMG